MNAACHCKMHYGGTLCDQCAASTAALSSFPSCRSDEEVVDDFIASCFNVPSSHLFTTEQVNDLYAQNIITNSRNEDGIRFLLEALLGIRYPAAPCRALSSDNLIKLKNVMIDKQILSTMHNNVSFVEVDTLGNTVCSENPWEFHNVVRLVIDMLDLG
jgi:hypothetical protein